MTTRNAWGRSQIRLHLLAATTRGDQRGSLRYRLPIHDQWPEQDRLGIAWQPPQQFHQGIAMPGRGCSAARVAAPPLEDERAGRTEHRGSGSRVATDLAHQSPPVSHAEQSPELLEGRTDRVTELRTTTASDAAETRAELGRAPNYHLVARACLRGKPVQALPTLERPLHRF